ncbi:hypothetical protein ACX3T3_05420 [Actinotignum schaalii]|uniref:hypothetical protein n=1 Tax=Actinotignum TaxID=1653174 RepID=UPI00237DE1CD|nr:hypothetical protein [Actinotignum sanguinis]MDE1552209.1 hypothetical protein [Actinotignum sanguinis]
MLISEEQAKAASMADLLAAQELIISELQHRSRIEESGKQVEQLLNELAGEIDVPVDGAMVEAVQRLTRPTQPTGTTGWGEAEALPPTWHEPAGPFDSYPVGARVVLGAYVWVSETAQNASRPEVGNAAWRREGHIPASAVTEFAEGIPLSVGQVVRFEGREFVVRVEHVTRADWAPPFTPAMFEPVVE